MSTCGYLDFILKFLDAFEHFALLSHGVDLGVPREVVDKGHVLSEYCECCRLCWSHTLEWITSRRPMLMFCSFANGCQCCSLNWQASHTPSLSFSSKVGSPMTTPFNYIPLSFWRLNMVDSFIPQLYIGVSFGGFCKHSRFLLMRTIENEHSGFSSSARYESTLLFDEAKHVCVHKWKDCTFHLQIPFIILRFQTIFKNLIHQYHMF